MILSLCGVDDEVVAGEYALTALGLQDRVEEHPALKGNGAAARKMMSSRYVCRERRESIMLQSQ